MAKKTPDLYQIEFAHKCVTEPAFFAEHVLGVKLWPVQIAILNNLRDNPRTIVQACHASGKSFVASVAVAWYMITHGPAVVFTTAPTGRQVKTVLWKEIHSRIAGAKIELPGRMLQIEWQIAHDHFAFGFATDTPDSFQGLHADHILGIFDEASGIHPDIWEAAEGNLSTEGARFLAIGNPLDPASEFYRKAHKDPRVKPMIISAYDTPHFYLNEISEEDIFDGSWEPKWNPRKSPWKSLASPSWARGMYESYSEKHAAYIVRVKGEFPLEGDNSLIPFWAIQQAQERWTENPKECEVWNEDDGKVGLDVAAGGADLSARSILQGGYLHRIRTMSEDDPEVIAGLARDDLMEFDARVVKYDAIGVGWSMGSEFRRMNVANTGINVGHRSRFPKRFRNIKAELYWGLRQMFVGGQIAIPPDDKLLEEELMQLQVFYPESGIIAIEPKEDLKDRIGRSPDRAESLMLAAADRGSYAIADGTSQAGKDRTLAIADKPVQQTSAQERILTDYFHRALKHSRRR